MYAFRHWKWLLRGGWRMRVNEPACAPAVRNVDPLTEALPRHAAPIPREAHDIDPPSITFLRRRELVERERLNRVDSGRWQT